MSDKVADIYRIVEPSNLAMLIAEAVRADDESGIHAKSVRTGEVYAIPFTDEDGSEIPTLAGRRLCFEVESASSEMLRLVPHVATVALGGYFESRGTVEMPDGVYHVYELYSSTEDQNYLGWVLEVDLS